MSKIISIGTAVPAYRHQQNDILNFMQRGYALPETEKRKLNFLYHHSGIETRYSVIPDYSLDISAWKFYPQSEGLEPFPTLEQRMNWFNKYSAPLSIDAIRNTLDGIIKDSELTHLITVSCTGMSAPGLDLQIMELLCLPKNIYRTSINFMGCYAAIHALKIADSICKADLNAKVLIVCTELCTLHFQKESSMDSMTASLLFGDGAAAVVVTNDKDQRNGIYVKGFYSEVISKGKRDMAWELSSSGFLMTLSGFIPELIEADFEPLVQRSLETIQIDKKEISHWCIHPGGKRILDSIHRSLGFTNGELAASYEVLQQYGNMSSASILFVLKNFMSKNETDSEKNIFGAAFGPGLTMETFVASTHA